MSAIQLAGQISGRAAALSASRELEPGARAMLLHAPGLFRLDVCVRGDTLQTVVRNLSTGPLAIHDRAHTDAVRSVALGEVGRTAPGATHLAFSLGEGGDSVGVRVLMGTLEVPDRGTVRVTGQAIIARDGPA